MHISSKFVQLLAVIFLMLINILTHLLSFAFQLLNFLTLNERSSVARFLSSMTSTLIFAFYILALYPLEHIHILPFLSLSKFKYSKVNVSVSVNKQRELLKNILWHKLT